MSSAGARPGAPWPAPSPRDTSEAVLPDERRRHRVVGWALVVTGALLLGLTAVVGWRALVGPVERFTTPGQVTIDCHTGDHWRIGPRTSTSRSLGPLTVTTGSAASGDATVTVTDPSGDPVDLVTMSGSETFTVNGDRYTAALTFRCPVDGPTTVAIDAAPGTRVAVFPAFGRVVRSVLKTLPLGVAGIIAIAAGIVLIVRRRSARVATRVP